MTEITQLSRKQMDEAISLYIHLLNHKEVQEAPVNPNMPMCKICNKTAKHINEDFNKLTDISSQGEEKNE